MTPARSRRRGAAVAVASVAAVTTALGVLAPTPSSASSHREAPYIGSLPQLDNTDLYAFVPSDDPGSVTLIANWIPFEEPNGGPNFYPWSTSAHYDINIDNDGDAKADLTYRWTFSSTRTRSDTFLYNDGQVTSLDDPNLLFRQSYNVDVITKDGTTTRIVSGGKVAPSDTGRASMPDYGALRAQAVASAPVKGGGKSYAGQADDPFFLDLRVFDLLYGGNLSEVSQDTLKGYDVNTVALTVPKAALALKGDASRNPVVGIWSTTSVPKVSVLGDAGTKAESGAYVQVSRLGNPLVNEVVVPVGQKDRFNSSSPDGDGAFLPYVQSPEVPKLVQGIYGIPAPATPRNDLVEVFLTGVTTKAGGPVQADLNSQLNNADVAPSTFVPSEQLRLNMAVPPTATPSRLGVLGGDLQGFPNGRRLGDDVLDIGLQALEGVLLPGHPTAVEGLGDGVGSNDVGFSATFPYVALPHDQAVNTQ